jgi:hypothetical protein
MAIGAAILMRAMKKGEAETASPSR